MADWNPLLYLKFKAERTQPVRDLIARVALSAPRRILDIGCGPGNSTAVLLERFPNAEILGIDYSPAMIERAREECPGVSFHVCDASGDLSQLGTFDLVFSNAFLQWLPNHAKLLNHYFSLLRQGGALAMQVPQFDRMPAAHLIDDVVHSKEFAAFFEGFEPGMHFSPDGLYYDTLSALSMNVSLWSTAYFHVMDNHEAVFDMLRSAGLRPYLDHLPEQEREGFSAQILCSIRAAYPAQKDGKVLFPFKRFFFVAYHT